MALTLGNDLTGLVSREVDAAGRQATGLGESMTTGINKFVPVVDSYLGNSLKDNEVVLTAVTKNTAYSSNMLTIANEYMGSVAKALQSAQTAAASAGQVSAEKIPSLQSSLDDKISQIKLLIQTADFDGKGLFSGDVKNIGVQVGLSTADMIYTNIKDASEGKILRSSVTSSLNDYIKNSGVANTHYPNDAAGNAAKATDISDNNNLIHNALTTGTLMTDAEFGAALVSVISSKPEMDSLLTSVLPKTFATLEAAGATFKTATAGQIATAIAANTVATVDTLTLAIGGAVADGASAAATATDTSTLIDGVGAASAAAKAAAATAATATYADHNAARTGVRLAAINAEEHTAIMQAVSPRDLSVATVVGAGVDVANAAAANTAIQALDVSQAVKDASAAAAAVAGATVNDVAEAALAVTGNRPELLAVLKDDAATDLSTAEGRVLALDVVKNALSYVRQEQSNILNQKTNILETTDALRATVNVTQSAADSYLKSDYVTTAQKYSETIRTMTASISSLQAANKIPEAAQRLLDALAR